MSSSDSTLEELLASDERASEFAICILTRSWARIQVPITPSLLDLAAAHVRFFNQPSLKKSLIHAGTDNHYPSRYHGYSHLRDVPKEILFLSHPEAGPWAQYPPHELQDVTRATTRGSGLMQNVALLLASVFERGMRALGGTTKQANQPEFLPSLFAAPPADDYVDRCQQAGASTSTSPSTTPLTDLLEQGVERPHQSVLGVLYYLAENKHKPQRAVAPPPRASPSPPRPTTASSSPDAEVVEVIHLPIDPRSVDPPCDMHTDYGIWSLIPESSSAGLETFSYNPATRDMEWEEAFPELHAPDYTPGLWARPDTESGREVKRARPSHVSMLVMAGEMLEYATGGAVAATMHRVVRAFDRDRRSLILFAFPRDEASLVPPVEFKQAVVAAKTALEQAKGRGMAIAQHLRFPGDKGFTGGEEHRAGEVGRRQKQSKQSVNKIGD